LLKKPKQFVHVTYLARAQSRSILSDFLKLGHFRDFRDVIRSGKSGIPNIAEVDNFKNN